LTYASRSGNNVVAERINDIIRSRSDFLPFSDNEQFSNEEFSDEEQEDMQHDPVSLSSQHGSNKLVLSNNLKKLPPSYKRSSSLTEKVITKKKEHYDDVISDNDSDDVTVGSHDVGDTPDEGDNTLQLFDDNDDINDNISNSNKGAKPTKPAVPFRSKLMSAYANCFSFAFFLIGSQSIKANPFKVMYCVTGILSILLLFIGN